MGERYFVLHLDERDFRPHIEARYAVQILNRKGEAEFSVYVDEEGQVLDVARTDAASMRPVPEVPRPVVDAARRQRAGQGDYVDQSGRSVRPF
jgi:hypothetical protein